MKNKRYILIGVTGFLILMSLFYFFRKEKKIPLIAPFDKNYLDQKIESKKIYKL